MGQKVSPTGFRLGITEEWRSRWYADKNYAETLENDLAIRKFLEKHLARAAVSKIEIERAGDKTKIIVTTARPGVVIGKKGAEIDALPQSSRRSPTVRCPSRSSRSSAPARCCAHRAVRCRAARGTRCVPPCDAQGRPVRSQVGRQGHPHQCSGRLGGAEMSRRRVVSRGRVPLHTLRAKIDYGFCTAATTMGSIGVQVWVYHGEALPGQKAPQPALEGSSRPNRRARNDRNERGRK